MVGFKNRYMVMEVFLDPNRDHVGDDPVIITQFNVSKAIKRKHPGIQTLGSVVWLRGWDHSRVSNKLLLVILIRFAFCLYIFFNNIQTCYFCIVKYVNPITNTCIIRVSREEYQKVWSAITMVRSIGNYPVIFNMLDLSGSIKACKSTAALKCEESKFEQFKLMVGDRLLADDTNRMQNYLDKIKDLEH